MKVVYKKSMAIELIKMGNDLEFTKNNRDRPQWLVYFFKHTDKLTEDMGILQERLITERRQNGTL